jgi:hypothetical protein
MSVLLAFRLPVLNGLLGEEERDLEEERHLFKRGAAI